MCLPISHAGFFLALSELLSVSVLICVLLMRLSQYVCVNYIYFFVLITVTVVVVMELRCLHSFHFSPLSLQLWYADTCAGAQMIAQVLFYTICHWAPLHCIFLTPTLLRNPERLPVPNVRQAAERLNCSCRPPSSWTCEMEYSSLTSKYLDQALQ